MAADRSAVMATVSRHLAEILEIDAASISETQSFTDDLGADSIALIELVDSLEIEFSATIPNFQFDDDDLISLKTVSDAVDYIVRAHA
jgi:acyl carrier protein